LDVLIEDHGTIVLLRPVSSDAFAWQRNKLASDAQYFGNAAVVEPRYVGEILDGMKRDGLAVRL
jgi:hypothetical protein